MEFWQQLITILGTGGVTVAAVLFGMSKWLGNRWETRIKEAESLANQIKLMNEKSAVDSVAREQNHKFEKEITELKNDLQKLNTKDEHFHQISQQTYQKLFEKKLEVYNEMFSISNRIKKNYPHINPDIAEKIAKNKILGVEDALVSSSSIFVAKEYNKLTGIIDENLTILSEELLTIYFQWEEQINPKMQSNNERLMKEMSKLIEKANNVISENLNESNVNLVSKVSDISSSEIKHRNHLYEALIYHNSFELFERFIEQLRKDVRLLNKIIDSAIKPDPNTP